MNDEESPPSINKIARTNAGKCHSDPCWLAKPRTPTHAAQRAAGSRGAILRNRFVRVLLWISRFHDSRLRYCNSILNRNQIPVHRQPLTRRARRLRFPPDSVPVEIPRRPGAERQSRENNNREQNHYQRRALASIIRVHQRSLGSIG